MNSIVDGMLYVAVVVTYYTLIAADYVRQLFNNHTPPTVRITPYHRAFVKIVSSDVIGMIISDHSIMIDGEPYWAIQLDPYDVPTLYPYSGTVRIIAEKLLIVQSIRYD